ncbi:MAG: sugar ABC transporter permease [Bacteroidetes bacterium]|nr:sugar ABC transporter permease [Bacteroidota bacterium]
MKFSLEKRKQRSGMIMVAPSLIVLSVFILFPIINSAYLSLFDFNLLKGTSKFIQFENYQKMFQEQRFWGALGNTFYFTLVYVPLLSLTALILAVLLDRKSQKATKFFQAIFFLPAITSMAIVAIGWRYILDPNIGILFGVLNKLSIQSVPLLQNIKLAMPTIIGISLWKAAGFNMVILLAGLKGISDTYYEAASIDGAGTVYTFFHITLPLLLPSLSFVIITNIISSFQVFDQIYVLTKGGPLFKTEVLVYYIYYQGFNLFKIGYASSLSFILFMIILSVTVFQLKKFMKHEVDV